MKVVMTSGIFPPDIGGPASYVPELAAELARRGARVDVVCLSDSLDHDDSAYPFRVLRMPRGRNPLLRFALSVAALLRRARDCDVIYSNGIHLEATCAAFLARKPILHKIVGDFAWERARNKRWYAGTLDAYQAERKPWRLRLLDLVRDTSLRRTRRVIVPSDYLAGIVAGWGVPREHILTIRNAVEMADHPGSFPRPEGVRFVLSTVCRLVPWKGVEGLIRALAELPATGLVVAGDGPLRGALEAEARRLGVAERVHFLGNVDKRRVAEVLAASDVFVLNSSYEGLPHVVLEAMQKGVPVVATRVGGTGEAVTDGETGLLVEAGDQPGLVRALRKLLEDRPFAADLAKRAGERLAAEFSRPAMVERTVACIRSVAGASTPGRKESYHGYPVRG